MAEQLGTQIGFIIKDIVVVGEEKVNSVGLGVKAYRYNESYFKEKAKYFDRKIVVFQAKCQRYN